MVCHTFRLLLFGSVLLVPAQVSCYECAEAATTHAGQWTDHWRIYLTRSRRATASSAITQCSCCRNDLCASTPFGRMTSCGYAETVRKMRHVCCATAASTAAAMWATMSSSTTHNQGYVRSLILHLLLLLLCRCLLLLKVLQLLLSICLSA